MHSIRTRASQSCCTTVASFFKPATAYQRLAIRLRVAGLQADELKKITDFLTEALFGS